jgi:hypothetical protein
MPVHVICPGCETPYAFSEQLVGRTARCPRCSHSLTVSDPLPLEETPEDAERPRRVRKKKRPADPAALGWKLAVGMGLVLLLLVGGALAAVFHFGRGSDKGPRLVGKWQGSVESRRKDPEVPQEKREPNAGDIALGLLQRLGEEAQTAEVEFRKSGKASFSGNTAIIDVPAGSDGSWEVLRREGDVLTVRMAAGGAAFEARLSFRDRDTFVWTRADCQDQRPVVFTRVKE